MHSREASKHSVNNKIQPLTEKEAYVWKACSALYFADELPLKAITQRRIMAKRALLEDGTPNKTKGDNSGLSEMKARWAAHHGIDPNNDPNQKSANPVGLGEDPLLRASKLVRDQLIEELEQQYQGVIDEQAHKAQRLEEALEQFKAEHAQLAASHDELNQELESLKPQHSTALEEIITLKAMVATLTQTKQGLQQTIEQSSHNLERAWQLRLATELTRKDQHIKELNKQSNELQSEIKATRDSLMEINENQRHQAMMEIEQLKERVTTLQSILDNKRDIKVQLAKTQQMNAELLAQVTEVKTQNVEQQAQVESLQAELSRQEGLLTIAQQKVEYQSTLKSLFDSQAQLIEQLVKRTSVELQEKIDELDATKPSTIES